MKIMKKDKYSKTWVGGNRPDKGGKFLKEKSTFQLSWFLSVTGQMLL